MNLDEVTTGPLTSLAELIDLEESLFAPGPPVSSEPPADWAFRGQPKTYGTLIPSFQRIFTAKKSVGAAQIIERDLMETFRKHYENLSGAPKEMPLPVTIGEGYDLRCLSVMQHYGVPTRLLDWTGHFWAAVYFACAGHPTDDAELWCYDRRIFGKLPAMTDLGVMSVSTSGVAPEPPEPVILVRGPIRLFAELDFRLTPRMREQTAHHTVASEIFADHGPLLQSLDGSGTQFRRVLIASSCKEKALRFLEGQKRITASTLYPDVEGLGRFLHWHLETLVTQIL